MKEYFEKIESNEKKWNLIEFYRKKRIKFCLNGKKMFIPPLRFHRPHS